jgi:hypothetical protein
MDDVSVTPTPDVAEAAVSRRISLSWLSWRSRITLIVVLTGALEFAALFGPGS